eukprot:466117_1
MTAFVLIFVFTNCLSQWHQPTTPTLPRATSNFAIGVYEHRIIMLGGYTYSTNGKQLFQYDIKNNVFIDNGTSFLSQNMGNSGTFYTQSANILYMMNYQETTINTYNLQSNQFITNITNIIIPNLSGGQCLTSTTNSLFIIGGRINNEYSGNVQMMDISTNTWSIISNMNEKRSYHSCIIDPMTNILYVIGGMDCTNGGTWCSSGMHKTIETIEINNINTQIWTYYGNLSIPSHSARSVWYNHEIFVISGKYDCCSYSNIMHIINTIDGTISEDSFQHRGEGIGVIIVDRILYAFGGRYVLMNGPPSTFNTWTYYNLTSTLSPTKSPSNIPSNTATLIPTLTPSTLPSINPTLYPSVAP